MHAYEGALAPLITFVLSLVVWVVILCTVQGAFIAMGHVMVPLTHSQRVGQIAYGGEPLKSWCGNILATFVVERGLPYLLTLKGHMLSSYHTQNLF